jgi:lipoprotein-anchoring transpeptidase ErfK/SrfK
VGSTSTPTPAGTFFVTDVLPWNPSDGRGAWVVALNGHSDAYATFDGGDARIAIHGTNDPSSIGRAVSNGCVRLDAGPLDQLRSGVPLGTPVVIQ